MLGHLWREPCARPQSCNSCAIAYGRCYCARALLWHCPTQKLSIDFPITSSAIAPPDHAIAPPVLLHSAIARPVLLHPAIACGAGNPPTVDSAWVHRRAEPGHHAHMHRILSDVGAYLSDPASTSMEGEDGITQYSRKSCPCPEEVAPT